MYNILSVCTDFLLDCPVYFYICFLFSVSKGFTDAAKTSNGLPGKWCMCDITCFTAHIDNRDSNSIHIQQS